MNYSIPLDVDFDSIRRVILIFLNEKNSENFYFCQGQFQSLKGALSENSI